MIMKGVMLKDKFSFVFSVVHLIITTIVLSKFSSSWMTIWYLLTASILIPIRYYCYVSQHMQYFLIDFCYFGNLLTVLYILFFPKSPIVFRLNYTSSVVMLISIITWRNSLVFHDFDKITSVFIHFVPHVLNFVLRWSKTRSPIAIFRDSDPSSILNTTTTFSSQSESSYLPNTSTTTTTTSTTFGFQAYIYDFLLPHFLFYLGWQFLYIIKTEVLDYEKFQRMPNLMTSFHWFLQNKKSVIFKLMSFIGGGTHRKNHEINGQEEDFDYGNMLIAFVVVQSIYHFIGTILAYFMYNYFIFNAIVMTIVFVVSVWNGASFYFDVFAKNYLENLKKEAELKRSKAILRNQKKFK